MWWNKALKISKAGEERSDSDCCKYPRQPIHWLFPRALSLCLHAQRRLYLMHDLWSAYMSEYTTLIHCGYKALCLNVDLTDRINIDSPILCTQSHSLSYSHRQAQLFLSHWVHYWHLTALMQLKTQPAYACVRTKPPRTARMKNVFHFATCIKDEVPKIPQICPSVKVSQPMNHQLSSVQCGTTEQTSQEAKTTLSHGV